MHDPAQRRSRTSSWEFVMKMLIVGAGVIGTVYDTHIAAAIASVAQNKRPESAVAGHGTA
jgi:hypothetical protein